MMAITTLQNISVESEENTKLYGPLTNLSATIFCDSQAAIKALDTHILKSQLVRDCKTLLNKACNSRPISICWIKAHVGLIGNEMADQEAKKGTTLMAMDPGPWLPPSH